MTDANKIPALSPEAFAGLGVSIVAYVKPVLVGGVTAYEMRAADGTQLGVTYDRAAADAALRRNELEPVSVH